VNERDRYIVINGQYPELPSDAPIFSVVDWQGQVLLEITLADLRALKALAQDEIQSQSAGASSHPGTGDER
jgi:hypothetical protein